MSVILSLHDCITLKLEKNILGYYQIGRLGKIDVNMQNKQTVDFLIATSNDLLVKFTKLSGILC